MPQARLYYEAHITVEDPSKTLAPIHPAQVDCIWDDFVEWAGLNGLRASRFDVDEVDHYDGAWFLSARDGDLDSIVHRVRVATTALRADGVNVLRWKIEDTVLDSKHGDQLPDERRTS